MMSSQKVTKVGYLWNSCRVFSKNWKINVTFHFVSIILHFYQLRQYFLSIWLSYTVISLNCNFRQNLKNRKLIQDAGGHHRFISFGHHGNKVIVTWFVLNKWKFEVQLTFMPNLKLIGRCIMKSWGEIKWTFKLEA